MIITRRTIIVDEMNRPLDRVHLTWGNGGGTTTDLSGKATVTALQNQRVTISYIGKETDYINIEDLPSKIVLIDKIDSLGEVVITSKKPATPNYVFPAIGAAALLLVLMSLGNEPKKITL